MVDLGDRDRGNFADFQTHPLKKRFRSDRSPEVQQHIENARGGNPPPFCSTGRACVQKCTFQVFPDKGDPDLEPNERHGAHLHRRSVFVWLALFVLQERKERGEASSVRATRGSDAPPPLGGHTDRCSRFGWGRTPDDSFCKLGICTVC